MPQCAHPLAHLHTQLRYNPHTVIQEHHLICDQCGKDIALAPEHVFLWTKLLEMRDMIAGLAVRNSFPAGEGHGY